jgi:hypothetical protein
VLNIGVQLSTSLFFSVSVFVTAGLWLCLSDPSLLQSLISKPQQARIHLQFVRNCLPHLEQFALEVSMMQLDEYSVGHLGNVAL